MIQVAETSGEQMRVLVTGGSGFIGTNLVATLSAADVDVINLDRVSPIYSKHASLWRRCDILDAARTATICRDFAPTHVVHLAARTDCYNKDGIGRRAQRVKRDR